MNPRSLRLSLLAVQLVGFLTLLRSVAYDRWITVLTSMLLIVGARAALRGRSWGIGLAFAAAAWFPAAWAIGIAPMWFVLVGMVGTLPFVKTWPAFARFDRGAAALLGTLAASAGALGAMAFKAVAWSLFAAMPMLRPSAYAGHGLIVTALTVAGIVAAMRARQSATESDARVRIAETSGVRIGETAELEHAHEADASELEHDEPALSRRART